MIRDLIYSALASNVSLAALVGDRIWPSGSLGTEFIPAAPELPYIQWGFDQHLPYREVWETSKVSRHMLRVWAYDERGDYLRLDEIHRQVRQTVEGLTGQISPSGTRCTNATFISLGGDLTDTTRGLNVKQSLYRLVSQ